MSDKTNYDLIVVGGGPAGLAAGIYGSRAGLSTLVIEQLTPGGQIALTDEIDNYPGIQGLSGAELGQRFAEHAEAVGCSFLYDEASEISLADDGSFEVTVGNDVLVSKALVYAAGATPRRAGFVGEEAFTGRGVSYCATCDGMFYRNKDVYVVGGGTAACEEAEFLARIARNVTMVVRRDVLRTTPHLRDRILSNEKITVSFGTRIQSVKGSSALNGIVLEDATTGEVREIEFPEGSTGVFVFVGHDPKADLVESFVDMEHGAVKTDASMATKTPGLFVAGDVRDTVLRQVATAVSDGAIAATSALHFIESHT